MDQSQRLEFSHFFFQKIRFSFRTSQKELIWCTNDPNVHMCIFLKRWSLILEFSFHVSILNETKKIDCFIYIAIVKRCWVINLGEFTSDQDALPDKSGNLESLKKW